MAPVLFCMWGSRGSQQAGSLSKVTWLVQGRARLFQRLTFSEVTSTSEVITCSIITFEATGSEVIIPEVTRHDLVPEVVGMLCEPESSPLAGALGHSLCTWSAPPSPWSSRRVLLRSLWWLTAKRFQNITPVHPLFCPKRPIPCWGRMRGGIRWSESESSFSVWKRACEHVSCPLSQLF